MAKLYIVGTIASGLGMNNECHFKPFASKDDAEKRYQELVQERMSNSNLLSITDYVFVDLEKKFEESVIMQEWDTDKELKFNF